MSALFLRLLVLLGSIAACSSFDESGICQVSSSPVTPKRIIDISHSYRPGLPLFMSDDGLQHAVKQLSSIANGSIANESEMKLHVHTGTHVDAPSHIFQEYYEAGNHVDTLDLDVLNGLALVVDVPRDTNLTAEAMQALHIPYGVERVIFRTLNTDRRLMWKRQFDTSYVGFTKDGAQWLTEHTKIKLIGIDYLSVAAFDYLISAHVVLLKNKDIILVEGLNLDDIDVGLYKVHCLPLKLLNSDGSPIRCVLEK